MKLVIFFIVLMFVPEFAVAQEMASKENVPFNLNEQAAAPQPKADRYRQIAYAGPADHSIIEVNALYAGLKFMADPNLYSEINQADRSEHGVIGDWRERAFKILRAYSGPRRPDMVNDDRLLSKTELDERETESRIAAKLVLKETLKFTQERLPEIDRLVNALKFEVSSDRTDRENAGEEADDKKTVEENNIVKDTLSVKTGLRVPVENSKFGLISETEARYGKASSFFKVDLDGQYDNSAGLTYVLGRDLRLEVERHVTHTTDPITNDKTNAKSNLNLIQMVYRF